MPKSSEQKPGPRGNLVPLALSNTVLLPAAIGLMEAVDYARDCEWLADVPQQLNPFEHLNNVVAQAPIQAGIALALIVAIDRTKSRVKESTLHKIANIGLLAGLAYQGAGELPTTQEVVLAAGFDSSTPGEMDFLYGTGAALGLHALNRRVIKAYASTHNKAAYGPSSIFMVSHPQHFKSTVVRASAKN